MPMNRRFTLLVCCWAFATAASHGTTLAQSPAGAATLHAPGASIASGRAVYFSSGGAASTKDGTTMRDQALANMKRVQANIAAAGFTLSDVIFVRAYLTPGPDGVVDYPGWERAWP